MINVIPVVLCGGSGTRLWPLSRAGFPKQFLSFLGKETLFQQSLSRLNRIANDEITVQKSLAVSGEEHRFLVLQQAQELGLDVEILLEPQGKNTAPALTLAACHALQKTDDAILVAAPSDQAIADSPAFTAALQKAVQVARQGNLVILGIPPTYAATGYGYIQFDEQEGHWSEKEVLAFQEKPTLDVAQKYITDKHYVWNSGIFVAPASLWQKAIAFFRPDIAEPITEAYHHKSSDLFFLRPQAKSFARCAADSVDYAVLEKCAGSEFSLKMVPLDAGWNDLGSWDAVWQVQEHDAQGNSTHGDVLCVESNNSLFYSQSRMIAAVGVQDLIVVETADALLIADKNKSQEVKKIVQVLKEQNREERVLHRKVYRPWGWYDSVDEGERFKVKRIWVNPGAKLSLQKHFHRAEHWIVVHGTAEITCGEQVKILSENESTYIPLGEVHRLANPGKLPLEIIEVQSGAYLGEDDIVRLQDDYKRN